MKYIHLLDKYYEAVHNNIVTVPIDTFTQYEIDYICKYVCYWYDRYTELSYESVGKMKRNYPATYLSFESNYYQLMMYFNYEVQILEKMCMNLDIMYKLLYQPELLENLEVNNEEQLQYKMLVEELRENIDFHTSAFEIDDQWKDINNHVKQHAFFTLLKKIEKLLEIAKTNESIIRSDCLS